MPIAQNWPTNINIQPSSLPKNSYIIKNVKSDQPPKILWLNISPIEFLFISLHIYKK